MALIYTDLRNSTCEWTIHESLNLNTIFWYFDGFCVLQMTFLLEHIFRLNIN